MLFFFFKAKDGMRDENRRFKAATGKRETLSKEKERSCARFEGLRRILKSVHCSIAPRFGAPPSPRRLRQNDGGEGIGLAALRLGFGSCLFASLALGVTLRKQGVQ